MCVIDFVHGCMVLNLYLLVYIFFLYIQNNCIIPWLKKWCQIIQVIDGNIKVIRSLLSVSSLEKQ